MVAFRLIANMKAAPNTTLGCAGHRRGVLVAVHAKIKLEAGSGTPALEHYRQIY